MSSWAAAIAAAALATQAAAAPLPLRVVARLPLPGASVRFDYTSFDPNTHRLWIAHMDANELLAFDVDSRRVVAAVPAPGVHGVIAVPQLNRVYASATDAHEVLTLDARTGAVLARAPAGAYPDGLAYDSGERHVFVSDESGGVETVLNAAGRRIATIPLGGEAGNVQYDSVSRRVYADVQTRDELAVIDPRANRVVGRVALRDCVHDHGLLVDSARRLAFVACDGDAHLVTIDLRTFRQTGVSTVGPAPDVLALDRVARRLYVSAESGVVSVFAETATGARRLGIGFLAAEAHTVAVDPRTHLVYFPLQSGTNGRPQLLVTKPA